MRQKIKATQTVTMVQKRKNEVMIRYSDERKELDTNDKKRQDIKRSKITFMRHNKWKRKRNDWKETKLKIDKNYKN